MKFLNPVLVTDRGQRLSAEIAAPVIRGRIPRWLRRRLPRLKQELDAIDINEALAILGQDWLDHWGTVREGDRELLISEPYELSSDGLRSLLQFAERVRAEVFLQAASFHYPTQTLRIILEPDQETFKEESPLRRKGMCHG
jgi:hypothetical protein